MKIVGYTYYHGAYCLAMKSDSSLLNQRKPFFLPDTGHTVSATRCLVLRISRMGRSIEPRFAYRYYDQAAWGIDFRDETCMAQGDHARALAFESSLAVGTWTDHAQPVEQVRQTNPEMLTAEQAISDISTLMTIRTGDLVYIDLPDTIEPISREQVLSIVQDGNELLYCKVK